MGISEKNRTPSRAATALLGIIIMLAVAGFVLLILRGTGRFVVGTINYVVSQIVSVSGWNRYLVKGLVIILTIPFFWAVAKYTKIWWRVYKKLHPSLRLYTSPYGIIIVLYVGAFFLAMYAASRGNYVTTCGEPQRWCAETPEGIRICDAPGVDLVYGVECKVCTQEQIALLRQQEAGVKPPNQIVIDDPRRFEFLDPRSGRARVWYWQLPDGSYRFYDGPGRLVRPVDSTLIAKLINLFDQKQAATAQASAAQAAAEKEKEHRSFLEKYLNLSIVNRKNTTEVAVLILGAEGARFSAVEDEIVRILEGSGVEPAQGLFRPAFIGDGLAKSVINGDWGIATRLGLGAHIDNIVLGQASVSYKPNPDLNNVLTATLHIDLKYIDVVTQRVRKATQIVVHGAGFSEEKALETALINARPEIEGVLQAAS